MKTNTRVPKGSRMREIRTSGKVLLASLAVAASCCSGSVSAETFDIVGDVSSVTYTPTRKIIMIRESGSVTVKGSGEAEVLLVGGGGGGGGFYADGQAGGGGGGGAVVHEMLTLSSTHSGVVIVGEGGVANDGGTQGPGGTTTAFGLTALGGGYGRRCLGWSGGAGSGACGGGATLAYEEQGPKAGGKGTQGYDGGSSVHDYYAGGGGGAGGPGEDGTTSANGAGGPGVPCAISGVSVTYGAGGAGGSGVDGTDGLGEGGGGGRRGVGTGRGGCGIVIVSIPIPVYPDSDDFDLAGGDETHHLVDRTYRVFRKDGTLTVTGEGTVELLIVGAGGAGGGYNWAHGGGGGGGGVLHLPSVRVGAGTYEITVGKGGDGCLEDFDSAGNSRGHVGRMGLDGGSSSAFGYSVLGGGGGAGGNAKDATLLSDAGCGGGKTLSSGSAYPPAKTVYAGMAAAGYHGSDGGTTASFDYPAGGGGAGGSPSGEGGSQCVGGAGYVCSITGTDVEYAGGGSSKGKDATGGGGRSGVDGGNGVDGFGGGGAGGSYANPGSNYGPGTKGGDGIVIVRYRPMHRDVIEGATGGTVRRRSGYTIHTFMEDGTFTMPYPGLVEVLLVGGGGGGGGFYTDGQAGGGGGAGGVIHKAAFVIEEGPHEIVIGKGGAAHDNDGDVTLSLGGDTTAFGLTALGGGYGRRCLGWNRSVGSGACGGGATLAYDEQGPIAGGKGTQGYDGGSSVHVWYAGGGGGAGGPGENGTTSANGAGGPGVPYTISGASVTYGAGGAGGSGVDGTDGLGEGGGGGRAGVGTGRGGCGAVIIRYKHPDYGSVLIVR